MVCRIGDRCFGFVLTAGFDLGFGADFGLLAMLDFLGRVTRPATGAVALVRVTRDDGLGVGVMWDVATGGGGLGSAAAI